MRSRYVRIFIITLITIQGLYVLFPLPDIWPFSNYSMFSKANPVTVTSNFEFYGVTGDGKELRLDSRKAFLPFDSVRLQKGVRRILNREFFILKQEKKLESAFKHLSFLPVDHAGLKKKIRWLLPYKNSVQVDKEKELRLLVDYLIAQYEHNREAELHASPPIVFMNLYLTKWDWTDVLPQEAISETSLVYSSEYGLSENE